MLTINFRHRNALIVIYKTIIVGDRRRETIATNLKSKIKMFFRPRGGHS